MLIIMALKQTEELAKLFLDLGKLLKLLGETEK